MFYLVEHTLLLIPLLFPNNSYILLMVSVNNRILIVIRDNQRSYGWLTIIVHWLSALAVVGLFALGYWMLTLSYYDPWYRLGPWWHKSIGILLLALTVVRVLWRAGNKKPAPSGSRF